MKELSKLVLFVCLVVFVSVKARAQANVNENLETAFLYVDAVNGNDSNPGTKTLPFKTVSKAADIAEENNRSGIGTRVTVNPGTYRESVSIGADIMDTSLPITFEAATNGTAIISGADVWTGWQVYSGNPSIYTNSWPYAWGLCARASGGSPFEQDIVLRREMIFVNGAHLTQVLALDQMVQGTFFVDEPNELVYMWPPAGTNINSATVEVATRNSLFWLEGKTAVVLRGLTFQYSNACRSDHAVYIYGPTDNILLDKVNIWWNNGAGLSIVNPNHVTDFTVQDSVANHNGQLGLGDFQVKNGLWQNDESSYNNWRGAQGVYYSWGGSGAYPFSEHNVTYNGFKSNFNQSNGLHFDTDNANITLTSLTAVQNLLSGVQLEKDEGPITFTSAVLCNNGTSGTGILQSFGGGLGLSNSEDVSLTGSTLYGNGGAQINVQGTPGGFPVTNWETGKNYTLVTKSFTNTSNTLEDQGLTQQVLSDSYLQGSDWLSFRLTLNSNNNTWWDALNSTTPFSVPTPVPGTNLDFLGWQATSLQDLLSVFAVPLKNPVDVCTVVPDAPDFWALVDNPSVTLDSSGSAVFNVTVQPVGAFSGSVALTYGGITEVPGLSAAFAPSTIVSPGTSAFTITAATSTAPGTYPVTVIANQGSVTRTATMSLVVPKTSVRLAPASLAFAPQQINTTSAPQNVTLTNSGTSLLSINKISANAAYTQTNTCGSGLAAGKSCTISVSFAPFGAGPNPGTLTVDDSDPTDAQTISLSGTGLMAPLAQVSPHFIAFGSQEVGTTSAPMKVTITDVGAVPLNFTGISLVGSNASAYSQTNTCGASINAGASCTISIKFTPQTSGTVAATVQISDNSAGNMQQQVGLTGSGSN